MSEHKDYTKTVNIGGQELELLLTTAAVKQIAKEFGGFEQLGEKLDSGADVSELLGILIKLVVILANQPILIHNLTNKDNPREELTVEMVELLTTPGDLIDAKDALFDTITAGMGRQIEADDAPAGEDADPLAAENPGKLASSG